MNKTGKTKAPAKSAAATKAPAPVEIVVAVRREKPGPKAGFKKKKLPARDTVTTRQPVLMEMLTEAAKARGDTPHELASEIGIGYPYLMALMRGSRPTATMEREKLVLAADYLDVSVAQVYIWAGALSPADFFARSTLNKELGTLYLAMRNHPDWGPYCPDQKEWDAIDDDNRMKLMLALLFEQVTGNQYLSRTHLSQEVVDGLNLV